MKFLPYLSLLFPLLYASDTSLGKGQEQNDKEKAEDLTNILNKLASANMDFALELYKHIAGQAHHLETSSPSNLFFSPFSISTALSMLSVGAKSSSLQQILEGLRFNQSHHRQQDVHKAFEHTIQSLIRPRSELLVIMENVFFLDEKLSLLPRFERDVWQYYKAEIIRCDFKDREEVEKFINDYAENKTDGKIKELAKNLDDKARMVLMNFILFKGVWVNPFHPFATQVRTFSINEKTTVEVPMMSRIGRYKIFMDQQLPCTIIEMPYKGNASMFLVIPELGKMHDIEEALSAETVLRWKNSAKASIIQLYVPRFSIRSSIDLKQVTSDMGMSDLFTRHADFSGITSDVKLKISKAIHRAALDVDEKGTEAAGSTHIERVFTSLPPTHGADKPFFIMICDKTTDTIIFMGRVVNPTDK
ncbi:alpha-1-antiproteinase-like [Pelodytes ibericus]